jgi:hypothetical protein
LDNAGNLYGTAQVGGQSATYECYLAGCGVVFELSPPTQPGGAWTETTMYAFLGSPDGNVPWAGLIFDNAGNLYGTTFSGGASNPRDIGCGTAFKFRQPKRLTAIGPRLYSTASPAAPMAVVLIPAWLLLQGARVRQTRSMERFRRTACTIKVWSSS